MNRDQLPLQMRRELVDLQPLLRQDVFDLVAIGLRLRGLLQVEQPLIPRRNLHALEAEAGSPFGDRRQRVERRCIASELSKENSGSLDGFHPSPPMKFERQAVG